MIPLTQMPALAPPPGVKPNFTNPESQALMVVVTSIICLVLTPIISLLRFYTSLWIKKSLKADDSKGLLCLILVYANRDSRVPICSSRS